MSRRNFGVKAKAGKHLSELRIQLANQCKNPLKEISLQSFPEKNLNLVIECFKFKELSMECQNWIIDLTERNMRDFYEASRDGWHSEKKLKEFEHKAAWILVAKCREADSCRRCSFVHFRFEQGSDEQDCAVYCYELQVEEEFQRQGIGKHMMEVLMDLAAHFRMNKVMLTVFKHNINAMNFYTSELKYHIDKSSPSKFGQEADYEILCLKVNQ